MRYGLCGPDARLFSPTSTNDHIIEIDDFDYSVSCVYRKTNGCYTYFDDINADFEDILDTLCERLRPE